MAKKLKKPIIDPQDDDFGAVLNCAVRYALGRKTYMPSMVIDFITPLVPHLNNKTLWCFDQDLTNAKWEGGYGDPDIDRPAWLQFHGLVRAERVKRGEKPYVSWREQTEEYKLGNPWEPREENNAKTPRDQWEDHARFMD